MSRVLTYFSFISLFFNIEAQTTQPSSYTCSIEDSNVQFMFSYSSHSAWHLANNCSLSLCNFASGNDSSACLRSSTSCYNYQTVNNESYCAPGGLCSLLEQCNNITGQCTSNASVCVINSCCTPQTVCLPLLWINLCSSTYIISRQQLSLLATVTASGYDLATGTPAEQGDSLVDRSHVTYFNSGSTAPQWVQLEFPGLYNISDIYLQVAQLPDGNTRHQISVGVTASSLQIVTDLNAYTYSGQWINITYNPFLTQVSIIRLDTLSSPSWVAWSKFLVYGF